MLQRLPSFAVRKVKSLTIEEGEPACMTSERQSIAADTYQYWNIRIQGRSFLYRQVSIREQARGCCCHCC